MAGKSSVVDEAADGVRTMFNRLGEFFHIFDLSFFVSGAATFGALTVLYSRLGIKETFPFADWVGGLAIFIACYICGLVSFSLGRIVNRLTIRRNVLNSVLKEALVVQALRGQLIERYLKSDDFPIWRLYARLWQELAENHPGSLAYSHLSRYWAMAATYDGLAISFLTWAVVLVSVSESGLLLFMTLIVASILCLYQGARHYESQVEDLVAALAVMRVSIDE